MSWTKNKVGEAKKELGGASGAPVYYTFESCFHETQSYL